MNVCYRTDLEIAIAGNGLTSKSLSDLNVVVAHDGLRCSRCSLSNGTLRWGSIINFFESIVHGVLQCTNNV